MKPITINTHIDCSNNSKCSVRDILLATKQGAFESVFGTFSVRSEVVNTFLLPLPKEATTNQYFCQRIWISQLTLTNIELQFTILHHGGTLGHVL